MTNSRQRLSFGEVVGTYGKAVVGLLVAFLTSFGAARGGGITLGEWLGILTTTVVATGAIWAIPKSPKWLRNYGKAAAGALTTSLGVLGTYWAVHNGLTAQAIIEACVAGLLNFVGPAAISNAASSDPTDARGNLVPVPERVKEALLAPGDTVVSTHPDGRVSVTPEAGNPQAVNLRLPEDTEDTKGI